MYKKIIKLCLLSFTVFSLTACNGFFEKDNIPPPRALQPFNPSVKPTLMWTTSTGASSTDDYLKMAPTIHNENIFTASTHGRVSSINKYTSKLNWKVDLNLPLSTGPGVNEGVVVVATYKGDVVALNEYTGQPLWKVNLPGAVLATPAIGKGLAVIKSEDGYVRALNLQNGYETWSYQQTEPSLLLRGASTPRIRDNSLIVGFANGSLAKLSLMSGNLNWTQTVAAPTGAFAIQRMVDLDADPVLFNHKIYAATYQGKIASLDWYSGAINWSHDISSYTGMAADQHHVFISDAKSLVWAFDANTGEVLWRSNQLEYRWVSGPALLGDFVVIGDQEGYLHWLNKMNGQMAARIKIGKAIVAAPLVDSGVLYVLAKNGKLSAYTLG